MKLPYISEKIRESKRAITTFGGLNHNLSIRDNEFYDMQNMTSDFFPVLSPRGPRGNTIRTFVRPHGLFAKDALAYVDGTDFYYDGTVRGTVEDSDKAFVGMGAYILIWPDKKYYNTASEEFGSLERKWVQGASASFAIVNESTFVKISCPGIDVFEKYDGVTISGCSNEEFNKTAVIQDVGEGFIVVIASIENDFTQASGLTISREVPAMDYVTECDNRIWGCSNENHEIYASKLGDPFNWHCYEGISTDSYAVTVGSNGRFTGAYTHLGYVLFLKEDCIHKIFGSMPSNFSISTNNIRGVAEGGERSLCTVNETLFYKTRSGVVAFEGGMPQEISEALGNKKYASAVAGKTASKYYISLTDSEGQGNLFAYDASRGIWHKEDSTRMLYTAYNGGVLYYIDADTLELKAASGGAEERVEWLIESGDLASGDLDNKYISKIQYNCMLEKGSALDIFLRTDMDCEWKKVFTVMARERRTYTIPIIPNRCQRFKIRIEGAGPCKIFGCSMQIAEGSEI